MAIGRTFPESLQKACAASRPAGSGLNARPDRARVDGIDTDELVRRCAVPTPERLFLVEAALRRGAGRAAARGDRHRPVVPRPDQPDHRGRAPSSPRAPRPARPRPARVAPREAARLRRRAARVPLGRDREPVRDARLAAGVAVTYKTVDTCAAEFAAETPYHYGTYEDEDEVAPVDRPDGRDPRERTEPHRPGRRVRLLLRARGVRALRRRLRDGDGQLQPRDGLDRLRHQRPAVLRAAHRRGRPQRLRGAPLRPQARPGRGRAARGVVVASAARRR